MITISDEVVSIINVKTEEEKIFINKCFEAEDFHNYLGLPFKSKDKYKLFSYNNKLVGCFSINLDTSFGTNIYIPNIYIYNKIYSFLCILKLLSFIAMQMDVDKVMFVVYSCNQPCLTLLNNLGINCDGILKYTFYNNGEYFDSIIYSILKSEINSYKSKFDLICR